jgi:peptidoglycan hydrolase-like protein with peptidoglycan-binding domain
MLEMLDKRALPRVDLDTITNVAANSSLARVRWRERGTAPLGYIKGMAVMFAVALGKFAQGDSAALEMARAASGDSKRDALAHYASKFAALGMRNEVSGIDTLRHLFVLLIGLGMRESSGRYCEGRDVSASNISADSAEAGLFQMSWDAHGASPEIPRLLAEYQANGGGFRAIFAEGVTCRDSDFRTFGAGTGATFQRLCKECPGFAVETAAVGLRRLRTHWGPINRHEVELRPEANEMLLDVQRAMAGMTTRVTPGAFDRDEEFARGTLWVQQSLNKLGANPRLDEDGDRGRKTMAAVSQFQRETGLDETGFADGATVAAIERKLKLITPPPGEDRIPAGPNEIGAWLERLVMLVERLRAQRTPTAPPPASQQTDQLRKALELLTAILAPGTDGKSPPLGQVNGALGQTLGNLLNGKKTAIGILGTVLTSVLSQVPPASGLGQVLALLTPAAGLSGFAMPLFLAIAAWGVLGKFEKWRQGTPPPRIT